MVQPNPDALSNRPKHGGRDRHFCVGVENIEPLEARLKEAGVEYTRSMSGKLMAPRLEHIFSRFQETAVRWCYADTGRVLRPYDTRPPV
jgi:hypothetical protein